jgi:hypothetical protein
LNICWTTQNGVTFEFSVRDVGECKSFPNEAAIVGSIFWWCRGCMENNRVPVFVGLESWGNILLGSLRSGRIMGHIKGLCSAR